MLNLFSTSASPKISGEVLLVAISNNDIDEIGVLINNAALTNSRLDFNYKDKVFLTFSSNLTLNDLG